MTTTKGGRACAHACCSQQRSSCSGARLVRGRLRRRQQRVQSNLSGSIKVDGSSTVGPLTEAAAELFREENPDVKITVGISGTGGGFEKFCAGETDIYDASRPIEPEEVAACKKKGIAYGEAQVANDGIAVVVNPENDWADCLTTAELKKIWEPGSKVNNWNQVKSSYPGRGDEAVRRRHRLGHVRVLQRGRSTATRPQVRKDYSPSEDDNVTVQGVAGGKGNLGYFGLSYAIANKDKVKALQVDGGDGCVDAGHRDGPGRQLQAAVPAAVHLPVEEGPAERGDGRVRQVLRRQLRRDRQAGAVRADDRGAGTEGQGRRHPAGGLGPPVGSSIQSRSSRSRRARSRAGSRFPGRRYGETADQGAAAGCAPRVSVLTTVGIVVALAEPTIEFFQDVSVGEFFTGTEWSPLFTPASFGVLPLVVGTLSTTFWACLVALPFGLGAAIYLSEYARPRTRTLAEAGAGGAGRDPDRRLRLLRAHRRDAVPAGHRPRRRGLQRALGRARDGRDDPARPSPRCPTTR